MRRLRTDVSHRIRRRGPRFLRPTWVRILVVGSLVGILGGALVLSLSSRPGGSKAPAQAPGRQAANQTPLARGIEAETPAASAPSTTPKVAGVPPGAAPGSTPSSAPTSAKLGPVTSAGKVASTGDPIRAAAPSASASPSPVFRVQIGAFLDHRNADRLVERLRKEGLGAATTVSEQDRALYRVLVSWPEATAREASGSEEDLAERVRALGFTVDPMDEGIAATGLVPLPAAEEASRRLREQGLHVRLREEIGSSTFRVVRVGSYATSGEAERALGTLAARGFGGLVIRER